MAMIKLVPFPLNYGGLSLYDNAHVENPYREDRLTFRRKACFVVIRLRYTNRTEKKDSLSIWKAVSISSVQRNSIIQSRMTSIKTSAIRFIKMQRVAPSPFAPTAEMSQDLLYEVSIHTK